MTFLWRKVIPSVRNEKILYFPNVTFLWRKVIPSVRNEKILYFPNVTFLYRTVIPSVSQYVAKVKTACSEGCIHSLLYSRII